MKRTARPPITAVPPAPTARVSPGAASAVVVFALIHIFLSQGPIAEFSPTYDEPVHLTAGYVGLMKGNFAFNGLHHPPLAEMWAALPLLWMRPVVEVTHPAWRRQVWTPLEQYQFADRFLYHNTISADRLMAAGRWMQVVLSVLMLAAIAWTGGLYGGGTAMVVAAGLWAFSPTALAHGTIVSTDLMFAGSFFLFFVALSRLSSSGKDLVAGLLSRPPAGLPASCLAGAALGLCFSSKFLAVAVGPALVGVWLWTKAWKRPFVNLRSVGVVAIVALGILLLTYRFSEIGTFFDGLSRVIGRSQDGRSSFFRGEHGTQGWLGYFPFVWLVKTPGAELLGIMIVLGAIVARRFKPSPYLWIPPFVFFLIACFSKVQIGHRHILATVPFLMVLTGVAVAALPAGKWIGIIFPTIAFIESWMVRPNFLSYFNAMGGGPSGGYRVLTDSNVDWGQGLKLLAGALTDNEKKNGIYLNYFGVAEPHAYGIRYLDVGSDTIAGHVDDSSDPTMKPASFAISVTNLQATYYQHKDVFSWLSAYAPRAVVANSIFIYDFSSAPEALARLAALRGNKGS